MADVTEKMTDRELEALFAEKVAFALPAAEKLCRERGWNMYACYDSLGWKVQIECPERVDAEEDTLARALVLACLRAVGVEV